MNYTTKDAMRARLRKLGKQLVAPKNERERQMNQFIAMEAKELLSMLDAPEQAQGTGGVSLLTKEQAKNALDLLTDYHGIEMFWAAEPLRAIAEGRAVVIAAPQGAAP